MRAWQTRFEKPTAETLLAGLSDETRTLADRVVSRFGRRPKIEWMGVPWCWTLGFSRSGQTVYLVPNPERLTLAARVNVGFFAETPPEALPRPVRDCLRSAACVGDGVWMEWTPPSTASLDAVLKLLEPA